MTVIGLRVKSNSRIYYCILEKLPDETLNYVDISHINIPQSLEWPEALNYVRNTIIDIITLYDVKKAVIRICEFGTTFNDTIVERIYIEGVLQETIASSNIEKYLAGKISKFAPLLNIQRAEFKKYADAEIDYDSIPEDYDWKKQSLETRETILTANAALNL